MVRGSVLSLLKRLDFENCFCRMLGLYNLLASTLPLEDVQFRVVPRMLGHVRIRVGPGALYTRSKHQPRFRACNDQVIGVAAYDRRSALVLGFLQECFVDFEHSVPSARLAILEGWAELLITLDGRALPVDDVARRISSSGKYFLTCAAAASCSCQIQLHARLRAQPSSDKEPLEGLCSRLLNLFLALALQ